MATQITVWKSEDGSVHLDERGARVADSRARVKRLSGELAEAVNPPYGDLDSIRRDLLDDGCQSLVLELATAITALRSLEAAHD